MSDGPAEEYYTKGMMMKDDTKVRGQALEAVYDVLYTENDVMKRITADHTAIIEVIKDVMKIGMLIRVEIAT